MYLHQVHVIQQQIELVKNVTLDCIKIKAAIRFLHANNAVRVNFLILLVVNAKFVHLGNLVLPKAFLVICASWVNIKVRKVNNLVVSVTKESTLTSSTSLEAPKVLINDVGFVGQRTNIGELSLPRRM